MVAFPYGGHVLRVGVQYDVQARCGRIDSQLAGGHVPTQPLFDHARRGRGVQLAQPVGHVHVSRGQGVRMVLCQRRPGGEQPHGKECGAGGHARPVMAWISVASSAGSQSASQHPGMARASARRWRYTSRGISCAPNWVRWSVTNWVSSSVKPPIRKRATRCTSATFEASRARLNMLSPKNAPPSFTPYNPPTSTPFWRHSTECAWP